VLCQLLKARAVKSSTMDGAHAACVGGRAAGPAECGSKGNLDWRAQARQSKTLRR